MLTTNMRITSVIYGCAMSIFTFFAVISLESWFACRDIPDDPKCGGGSSIIEIFMDPFILLALIIIIALAVRAMRRNGTHERQVLFWWFLFSLIEIAALVLQMQL